MIARVCLMVTAKIGGKQNLITRPKLSSSPKTTGPHEVVQERKYCTEVVSSHYYVLHPEMCFISKVEEIVLYLRLAAHIKHDDRDIFNLYFPTHSSM